MQSNYSVPMVKHTVKILEAFSGSDVELSLKEISARAGVGTTSTFRILFTLSELNFIFKNPGTGKYRLGPGMMQAAWRAAEKGKLGVAASPYLDRLHEQFNETVNLAALEGKAIIYLDIRESSRAFRMTASVGSDLPVHATALGKAMSAFLAPDVLDAMLHDCKWAQLTPHTITNRAKWKASLARIRKQGYAIDKEETELGAVCIAAPILSKSNAVLAGVSISGPTPRIIASKDPIIAELKKAAHEISLWL